MGGFSGQSRQQGAVLAVTLIILLVLTLIVVRSSDEVVLQEKMSVAHRDAHISLMAAEIAIAEAKTYIASSISPSTDFSDAGVGGLFSIGNGPVDVFDKDVWADGSGQYREAVLSSTELGSGVQARYYIEDLGTPNSVSSGTGAGGGLVLGGHGDLTGGSGMTNKKVLRIVVRAAGLDGNTERVLVALATTEE